MRATTIKYAVYTVAIVAGAVIAYQVLQKGKKVGAAVGDLAQSLNPTSSENIVYKTVSAAASLISGDSGMSNIPAGTRLWEWLNPAAVEAERKLLSNGAPDKNGRFLGGDQDEFGNAIERTAPVPSGAMYEWGPSIMSEMQAP